MTVSMPIGRRATKCLVPGAAAIYLFNEGVGSASTTLRDYSGNARDGTFGPSTAAPTWSATGLYFDGGDRVTASAAGLDAPPGLTVIAVATVANTDTERYLSCATGSGVAATGWLLTKGSTATRMLMYDAGGNRCMADAAVPATGSPVFVAGVWNGTTVTAYNGLAAGAPVACVGHTAATAQDLTIGRSSWANSELLVGTLHAALIYPFALTLAQLATTKAALAGILAPRGVTLA